MHDRYSAEQSGRERDDRRDEMRGAAVGEAIGPITTLNQTQRVGLGRPAILHACLAGP